MATMSVEVLLSLVDNLTGPAKAAAGAIRDLVKGFNQLKTLSGGGSGGMTGFAAMAGEMKAMREQMTVMASEAKTLSTETKISIEGIGKAFAGIPAEVMSATRAMVDGMNQMKRASDQMQADVRRNVESANPTMAAGGAVGGGEERRWAPS